MKIYSINPSLSKRVGWDPIEVEWPETIGDVNEAGPTQLLRWYRFLPAAPDGQKRKLIKQIMRRLSL